MRFIKNTVIMFLMLVLLCSCQSTDKTEMTNNPKTMQECYQFLDTVFSNEEKKEIMQIDDPERFAIRYKLKTISLFEEWFGEENSELMHNINYGNWEFNKEDLGFIVKKGYWYYLNGIDWDWGPDLASE